MPSYTGCIMLKIFSLLVLLGACAVPAIAGPCVALDYQEMKDMSADQLTVEACKARDIRRQSLDESIATHDPRVASSASDNFEQCTGQIERIERVLTSKGISKDAMKDPCTKQAHGKMIAAPTETK
jgi:hypothetical protein